MTIQEILTQIGSSVVAAAIVGQFLSWRFNRKLEQLKDTLERNRDKASSIWKMKRDACLRALNVANAVLSNYKYENLEREIIPQHASVEEVRAVFNELACSCDSSAVLEQLRRIMFDSVTPAAIVDLRNAVRRELNFSETAIDRDTERAFVGAVNCHLEICGERQASLC